MISAIVAIDENNAIGKDNHLLEKISKDMQRFKELTMNRIVIMGYNTYKSIPSGKLPNRFNIIISKNTEDYLRNGNGVSFATSKTVEKMLDLDRKYLSPEEKIWIIGGEKIYRDYFHYIDKLYVTKIFKSFPDADRFFPEINKNDWEFKESSEIFEENGTKFQFLTYTSKNSPHFQKQ